MWQLHDWMDRPEPAEILAQNWPHDSGSVRMLRISSNAVYTLTQSGVTRYLRFCRIDEKSCEHVAAELAFLRYLSQAGYGAAQALPTPDGELLVYARTARGEYAASLFEAAPGTRLDRLKPTPSLVRDYGAALGRLHRLSQSYQPRIHRWDHAQVLDWCKRRLRIFPEQEAALRELSLLRGALDALPRDPAQYGMIHFDFEADNVFVEPETGRVTAIDFDDCMLHWYGMDVEQSLQSLREEMDTAECPDAEARFLEGYRAECALPEEALRRAPLFRRFADLYGFVRVLCTLDTPREDDPRWMKACRARLTALVERRSRDFGAPLPPL